MRNKIAFILIALLCFTLLTWALSDVKRKYTIKAISRIEDLAHQCQDLLQFPDSIVVEDSIYYILTTDQRNMLDRRAKEKFIKLKAIVDSIAIVFGIE